MSLKTIKKRIKKILFVALSLIIVLTVVILVTIKFFLGNVAKFAVEQTVPVLTGAPASLGGANFKIFLGELRINDFFLGNRQGQQSSTAEPQG